MKRFALLAISLLVSTSIFAQDEIKVRRIEVEPSIGYGGNAISLSLEVRNNISARWDIGPRASMDFHGSQASIVSDYNFVRPDKDILFFVGGGVGLGRVDLKERDMGPNEDTTQFYVMPRAGIELFQHLRITLSANTYNFSAIYGVISLGVVFGGGRK